jgi:hypothetical protein
MACDPLASARRAELFRNKTEKGKIAGNIRKLEK